MANTLRLEIVTPEAKTFSDDVDMVVLPAAEGEMGIYPMHVPLMTEMVPGELRVLQDGKETAIVVGSGFIEVTGNRVSVLTDMALDESTLTDETVEAAIARAEAAKADAENLTLEELAATEAAIEKSITLLQSKRRKHGGV